MKNKSTVPELKREESIQRNRSRGQIEKGVIVVKEKKEIDRKEKEKIKLEEEEERERARER